MLEAKNLGKRFGDTTALDDISLSVAEGEIYALLGANGAGKTTLINLFLGFLEPSQGEATVGGVRVSEDVQAARRQIGYIPEQVTLYGSLTGLENLEFFTRLAGASLDARALLDLLAKAGLDETSAQRRLSTYSKGMRQKVSVAIALAKRARALLLDEPTSGLDPQTADDFMRLIASARDSGVAVLMTTHDLFHARQVASRIGIMRAGRLVAEIAADDVDVIGLQRLYLDYMKSALCDARLDHMERPTPAL